MRTTLTLEDDVAARLEQTHKRMNLSIKQVVNISLRAGLNQLEAESLQSGSKYKIQSASLGAKLPNLDNIAEILELTSEK